MSPAIAPIEESSTKSSSAAKKEYAEKTQGWGSWTAMTLSGSSQKIHDRHEFALSLEEHYEGIHQRIMTPSPTKITELVETIQISQSTPPEEIDRLIFLHSSLQFPLELERGLLRLSKHSRKTVLSGSGSVTTSSRKQLEGNTNGTRVGPIAIFVFQNTLKKRC